MWIKGDGDSFWISELSKVYCHKLKTSAQHMIYFFNTEDVNYPFKVETMLYYDERMRDIHFSVNWAKKKMLVTFGWLGQHIFFIDLG